MSRASMYRKDVFVVTTFEVIEKFIKLMVEIEKNGRQDVAVIYKIPVEEPCGIACHCFILQGASTNSLSHLYPSRPASKSDSHSNV